MSVPVAAMRPTTRWTYGADLWFGQHSYVRPRWGPESGSGDGGADHVSMLYVLTATSKNPRHATALGMFEDPGMANLAAAMLRSNPSALVGAGEISVHKLPPRPASCLDALHHEIHPEGFDDSFSADEDLARSAA